MSNVLIGIIGVILFIGLALAGALYLGEQFQQATVNSRASAAVQAVNQIVDAIHMREVQEGILLPASMTVQNDLVATGYLKAEPSNPTGGSAVYTVDQGGVPGAQPVVYVVLPLRIQDTARDICAAVVRQTGMTADGTIPSGEFGPTHPVGCTDNGGGVYAVYAKVR